MHLCENHRQIADNPYTTALERTQGHLNKMQPATAPRCGTCKRTLMDRQLQLCEECAVRDRLCQACSSSTLTPIEQEAHLAHEAYEQVLDLATLAMKAYGIGAMRELLLTHRDMIGAELVDRFFTLDTASPLSTMGLLDRRIKRPIWTRVLGANVFRTRRCQECGPLRRGPAALAAAARCGHLTPGLVAAWCALCAAEHDACEGCGSTTEAGTEGSDENFS